MAAGGEQHFEPSAAAAAFLMPDASTGRVNAQKCIWRNGVRSQTLGSRDPLSGGSWSEHKTRDEWDTERVLLCAVFFNPPKEKFPNLSGRFAYYFFGGIFAAPEADFR